MVIPKYQAEISHRHIRGRVTCLQQLFGAVGQFFATDQLRVLRRRGSCISILSHASNILQG